MYIAGEILVPSGGGPVTVDVPADGLIFFGVNFSTLGSIDTSGGTGIFLGFAAPDVDSPGTIRQHAIGIVPDGDAWCSDFSAIMAPHPDGSGNTIYRGNVTALGDSFTVNFVQGAAGMRVFYLAISDFEHTMMTGLPEGSTTKTLGWKVLSVLASTIFDLVGGGGTDGIGSANFYHGAGWGGGSFGPASSLDWTWGWLAASSFPTSASSQGISETMATSGSTPHVALSTHFTGPFMITGIPFVSPTGPGLGDFAIQADPDNYVNHLIWDGESEWIGFSIPGASVDAQADTTFPLLEAVNGLLTMSCSDAPQGQSGGAGGAAGFGFATEEFQCCALIDAHGGRGGYQSNEHGWASMVNDTSVRAGTVEFNGNIATLINKEGGSAAGSLVGFGFADEDPNPGFFRVVYR